MARFLPKLNRWANRNKGVIAILAVAVVAVPLFWPQQTQAKVEEASESDWWQDFTDLFTVGNGSVSSSGDLREAQIKYDDGRLSSLGVVEVQGAGQSQFAVDGTSNSGDPARFELFCGAKVCGTITDSYQEPLTYWVVTIPDKTGLTKLVVTAGAANLEVEL